MEGTIDASKYDEKKIKEKKKENRMGHRTDRSKTATPTKIKWVGPCHNLKHDDHQRDRGMATGFSLGARKFKW